MSFWHDQQNNVQGQISELEQKIAALQRSGVPANGFAALAESLRQLGAILAKQR
jgi:hypothetical protein